MERTLLAVELDDSRWHVLVRGKRIEHHDTRAAAIDAAACFARIRHDATGEPTGVNVPMGDGEMVLLAACG